MRFFSTLLILFLSIYTFTQPTNDKTFVKAVEQQTSNNNSLFVVNTSGIDNLPIGKEIISELQKLPYISKEKDDRGKWNLRIKANLDNTKIIMERNGFWKVAEFSITEKNLVQIIIKKINQEAIWLTVKDLENKNSSSQLGIEIRVIPLKIVMDSNGFISSATPIEGKPVNELNEGDFFTFEIANVGKKDVYISILDLTPDGKIMPIFPHPAVPEIKEYLVRSGTKSQLPFPYVFRATPPFGIETFKVFATSAPNIIWKLFDEYESRMEGNNRSEEIQKFLGLSKDVLNKNNPQIDWVTANFTLSVGQPRTLHVLSVGISNYQRNVITSLGNLDTEHDIKDFTSLIEEYGRNVFDRVNVKVLQNERATKQRIISAFREIISQAKPQDTFVFQFSGQTTLEKDKTNSLFIPFDYDPRNLQSNSITTESLQIFFSQIQANRQFALLDSCYSTNGSENLITKIEKENIELKGLLQRDIWLLGAAEKNKAYESLDENGKRYGTLTLSIIKGMRGLADADSNGKITIGELFEYSTIFLNKEGRNNNYKLWKTGNDFVLLESPLKTKKVSFNYQPQSFFVPVSYNLQQNGSQKENDAPVKPQETPTPQKKKTIVRAEIVGQPQQNLTNYQRKGKDYALLIGTNDYQHWSDLQNPLFDIEAVAEELKNYYGFEVEVVKNPTKKDVLDALRRVKAREYNPDDQLFIFFAGHGHYNDARNEGYLVFSEGEKLDKSDELCESCDTYLSHSTLRNVLNNIKCDHIFVVLDACFSGTFDESIKRGDDDPLYENATNKQMIERIMKFKTRIFLTSGGKEYVPDGRAQQHSPFARRFLEALRSYGGEYGLLTFNGILARVERVIPMPRKGEWGDNEPGSDFVFEVKKKQ